MSDDRLKRLLELRRYAQEQGFNLIVVRDFMRTPEPVLEPTGVQKIYGVYVENGYMDYHAMSEQILMIEKGPKDAS